MITGIVVALPEETSTLTSQKIAKGSCCFINDRVLMAFSGTGSSNAEMAAEQLIAQGATRLISWGCAAALSEQLKSGDLNLAASLIDADGNQDAGFAVTGEWHAECQALLAKFLVVNTEPLLESKNIISASSEKKRLFTRTGAYALDMESVAVARVAKQNQLPFIAIRAIADPVNMDLPLAIKVALNAEGELEMRKLLGYLLSHPGELPGLIKVGLQFNAARKTLKLIAKQLDTLSRIDLAKARVI